MNVSEIMTEKPITVTRDTTLSDAMFKMRQLGCHHLPVLGHEKHLVGIVSERDCMQALNSDAAKRDPHLAEKLFVREVMTGAPIIIEPGSFAEEAARLMLENYIGALPVVLGETLVGIVTKSDILMAFMQMCKRNNLLLNHPEHDE